MKKISWRYPLIELVDGLLITLFTWTFLNQTQVLNIDMPEKWLLIKYLGYWFLIVWIIQFLLITFIYDYKKKLVSDGIIMAGIGVSLILHFGFHLWPDWEFMPKWFIASLLFDDYIWGVVSSILIAGLGAGGFFLSLNIFSKGRWIGGGDVKLIFWLGILFGWPHIWLVLMLAFLSGSVIGLYLIFKSKNNLKKQVPFAPFLTMAAFVIILWGDMIYDWYFNLLGLR
jgi:prepilin signal peptidase PulO-like enzyme (type II secretory pathway)